MIQVKADKRLLSEVTKAGEKIFSEQTKKVIVKGDMLICFPTAMQIRSADRKQKFFSQTLRNTLQSVSKLLKWLNKKNT